MPNLKIVKRYNIKSLAEDITALEIEFDEVADRYESLDATLKRGDALLKQVGDSQYLLMVEQLNAMRDYRDILAVRLSLLRRANAKSIASSANAKAIASSANAKAAKTGIKAKAVKA